MTDPLDALFAEIEPVSPPADFAAELRAELERAILPPEGTEMTTSEATRSPAVADHHSLSPYLAVPDAHAALDFYVEVFGAQRRADPIIMPDGKVGHAELAIGDSILSLAEEFEEIGHTVAPSGGPAIRIEVVNARATVELAETLGAHVEAPVRDEEHGTQGNIRDPFGQRWLVAQAPARGMANQPVRHGQAGYFTFTVPDDEAAKEFYGAVLGWQFTPGRVDRAWGAEGPGMTGSGVWGGQSYAGWKLMYAVDDIHSAVERVRAHGGQAVEPTQEPYGTTADCVDNQGVEFWLWQA